MSLLTQLNKLNIPNEDLVNLTDNEIIRIEKKLKAEVKMGGSLDINEVNSIIKLLKDNKEELKLFLDEKFSWFRRILTNPDKLIVFPLTHPGLVNIDEELKDFVATNFQKELTQYYTLCLYQNHYRALNSFLAYNPVLPDDIIEEIQLKFIQKLEYGMECIEMNAMELEKKIEHLYNPFFFRCVNSLETIYFEDIMNDLTNSFIENLNKIKALKRGLFSLGAFKSADSELRSVISQNKNYARENGVSENSNFTKFPKGGTNLSKFSGEGGFGIGNMFWIAIVVLMLILRVGRTCNDSTPDFKNSQVQVFESMESYQLFNKNKLNFFIENVKKLQSNEIKILREKEIDFTEENISHKSSLSSIMSSSHLTEIINETDKPVLFVFKVMTGVSYFCIEPNSSKITNDLFKKFIIYTGKKPVEVTYEDKFKKIKYGFKFKEFDEKDKDRLNLIIDKSDYNDANKNYRIIITKEKVEINEI